MFRYDRGDDAVQDPPVELVVDFRNTQLPFAAIRELIRSHHANTYIQIEICARYYKHRALKELFPNRASISGLRSDQKNAVYSRAIHIAENDARTQVLRAEK